MEAKSNTELVWCKLAKNIGTLLIKVNTPNKNCREIVISTNIRDKLSPLYFVEINKFK